MPNVTSISKDYGYLILYAMIRYVSSQMAYQMEENSFRGCVPEISAILLALSSALYRVATSDPTVRAIWAVEV